MKDTTTADCTYSQFVSSIEHLLDCRPIVLTKEMIEGSRCSFASASLDAALWRQQMGSFGMEPCK